MNASELIPLFEEIKPNYVNKNDNEIVQYFQNNKFKMDALMFITMHNSKVHEKLKNEYEIFKRKYSSEIHNLNKTITKKKNIINNLINDIKTQKINLNKIVNEKVKKHSLSYENEISELNIKLNNQNELITKLELENKVMKSDYENFKTIKNFEIIKNKLQKYVKDLNDINELNSFLTNIEYKELLETIFNTEFNNIISKYHELRINRNNIAHLLYMY